MSITLTALMKQRYDTAANWTAQNPTLLAGEFGIESDTKRWKVGTGATAWTSLLYSNGGTYPLVNADIAANAEIAVSKLADGSARQLLQTDAAGTGVEWTSDVSIPGVLAVTAGTAALPGIAVSGDLNTGIYTPGADQLAISTGGTSRLAVSTTAVSSTLAVDHPLGAVGTPSITFTGDLNTGIWSPAADTIAFSKGGAESMRIDSSGRLLVGTSSARGNFDNGTNSFPQFQVENASGVGEIASFVRNQNDIYGCVVALGKTRGSGVGSNTVVNNGDKLGRIVFAGADGSELVYAAEITAAVDGTPGANDMPGRLVFSTTGDGAASPTERMRIDSTGLMTLAGPGIKFPATQVASTDPNTLDDYEEGTWTPNQGSGLTVVGTFVSSGTYTKIGRQLFITGQMSATTIAVAAGGVISTNLPFSTVGYGAGGVGNFTLTNGAVVITGSLSIYSVAAVGATGGIEFAATCIV